MIKVAIYCRLSDEDKDKLNAQDESESIQNQKSMLIAYAMEKGWDIYKIYCDEDYSGADKDRPEFNELLKDAENKKFNIVLCKTQSRFTRDMEIVEKYIHGKFLEWGIRFISIIDNADTDIKGNKKSRQINGLVNEWYVEDTSENIRKVLRHKKELGQFCGSFAPYGYQKDPTNKSKLIVDTEAAQVVKMIYRLYLEGYGMLTISQKLNAQNISTPSMYKKLKGYNFNGGGCEKGKDAWDEVSIREILSNPTYTGDLVQGKYKKISYKSKKQQRTNQENWIIVENTHEPIISKEDYERVQCIRKSRSTKPNKEGKRSIFAGKIRCLDCNSSMTKFWSNRIEYMRCKKYGNNTQLCTPHSIIYKKLIEIIKDETLIHLNELCEKKEEILKQLIKGDSYNQKEKMLKNQIKKTMINNQELDKALSNLYIDKVNNKITEQQFNIISNELENNKKHNLDIINNLNEELDKLSNLANETKNRLALINKYKNFDELTYEIVNMFIKTIHVAERTSRFSVPEIFITWNF